MLDFTTIAAVATPPGKGGIAVIRISGPQCYTIADKVFKPLNEQKKLILAQGYTALYGGFFFRGRQVDDGIALCFRAPHSYTGEDVIELSCHGGEEVSREVLLACLEAGALPAGPGEFTKRAVLNGRISLTQAEGVMELISATSRQGVAAARAALSGALYKAIKTQKQQLTNLAGHLAAYVDYPEEDVDTLTEEEFNQTVSLVKARLDEMISQYGKGSILRRGVNTAIVGSPNVGKSTLFNLLSGFERAIVTPVAGTTRDVIRESIQLGGVTLNLSDTAGLHETEDFVEQEGIRRSYTALEQASLVVAVFDGSKPLQSSDFELAAACKGRISLAIVNKSDIGLLADVKQLEPYFAKVISVSAKEEETRNIVEEAVLAILQLENIDMNAALLANERQLAAVVAASSALGQAAETIQNGFTMDAAGVFLEDALQALAELTGESASEAIIEDVFSRFCVGK